MSPALRRDLTRSLDVTPDVLAQTIETLRVQLRDHLKIAERAWAQEDLETWAQAARHAANAKKSLEENLEMQSMTSIRDLSMFTAGTLVSVPLQEALAGDKTAEKALRDAVKKLDAAQKKERANVRG